MEEKYLYELNFVCMYSVYFTKRMLANNVCTLGYQIVQ